MKTEGSRLAASSWRTVSRCAAFLLFGYVLSVLFSIVISWLEMQALLSKKGPGYANEFLGTYLVGGFIFGQIAGIVSLPAGLLVYFKSARQRLFRHASLVALLANVGVWMFFNLLAVR